MGGWHVCSLNIQEAHATDLITTLAMERISKEADDHPIIWVAHSLGGILVKRALEISSALPTGNGDDLRSIYTSTYGVMFLGTPHNAEDPARWRLMLQAISSASMPQKAIDQSHILKARTSNTQTLQDINLKFLNIYPNRFKVCMVLERIGTDLKGTRSLIVDEVVAGPRLPDVEYFEIEATHLAMCKFGSDNLPGYSNVSHTLKSWVQKRTEHEPFPQIRAKI
jgi:hypothetical protein